MPYSVHVQYDSRFIEFVRIVLIGRVNYGSSDSHELIAVNVYVIQIPDAARHIQTSSHICAFPFGFSAEGTHFPWAVFLP